MHVHFWRSKQKIHITLASIARKSYDLREQLKKKNIYVVIVIERKSINLGSYSSASGSQCCTLPSCVVSSWQHRQAAKAEMGQGNVPCTKMLKTAPEWGFSAAQGLHWPLQKRWVLMERKRNSYYEWLWGKWLTWAILADTQEWQIYSPTRAGSANRLV